MWRRFYQDEEGMQTIEMVIILVVLVSLALAFRKTLIRWFNDLIGQTPTITAPNPQENQPIVR